MALLGIDELNLIDTYFDEMELSEEDKENRVDLCEDLFYIYYYIFALISTDFRLKRAIDIKEYTDKLSERFKDILDATEYAPVLENEEITNYITEISNNLVESTLRNLPVEDEEENLDDIVRPASPYWSSTERAIRVAEDMTNVIANYKELQDKIAEGYTHKTWVSILDTHTRESHWLAWGKTLPINKPFTIGSSLMMCPCDHTAPAREIVNCRCKLVYSVKKEIEDKGNIIPINLQFFSKESKQLGKKLGKHCGDFGLDPSKPQDRQKMIMTIKEIMSSKNIRTGTFRGQGNVLFYIKDNDVVVTKMNGEFVTILKGGINNARVKESREYTIQ